MFGPATIANLDTHDVTAPGAPALVAAQVDNHRGTFTFTPPAVDADGSPLTGLTLGRVIVIQADAPTTEGFGSHPEDAALYPGAQVLTFPLDAGGSSPVTMTFDIQAGQPYGLIAQATDDAP